MQVITEDEAGVRAERLMSMFAAALALGITVKAVAVALTLIVPSSSSAVLPPSIFRALCHDRIHQNAYESARVYDAPPDVVHLRFQFARRPVGTRPFTCSPGESALFHRWKNDCGWLPECRLPDRFTHLEQFSGFRSGRNAFQLQCVPGLAGNSPSQLFPPVDTDRHRRRPPGSRTYALER